MILSVLIYSDLIMKRFVPCFFLLLFITACVPHEAPHAPEKTQLEIREYQTRTFDVNDYSGILKSILDVLQDDGYMIKNVSSDLGFLSATKEESLSHTQWDHGDDDSFGFEFSLGSRNGMGMGLKKRVYGSRRASYATHEVTEATINVSQFGDKVRVRASFQSKIFDNNNAVMRVEQITDEYFYQDFFVKVSKGIFIQEQQI